MNAIAQIQKQSRENIFLNNSSKLELVWLVQRFCRLFIHAKMREEKHFGKQIVNR